jgi:DNA polymerase I
VAERVALIDGLGLAYRAFHAIPGNLRTTSGQPTNAIFGFAKMFRTLLAGRTPTLGAVVFDAPGPTHRHQQYAAYKAHRPSMPPALASQLPWIERLVTAHHYPILRVPGVEADDVIGTLAAQAVAAGHEVTIVSGDKDFAQLVSERVRLFDSTKEVVYDPDRVRRRWGVLPERFVDWLALVGDASDNIPGVPGIGAKGAAELLRRFDSVETLLACLDELTPAHRKALTAHADDARLSRQLATIRTDVPLARTLDDLHVRFPTPEELDVVYMELEFHSLLSPKASVQANSRPAAYFVCDTLEMATAAVTAECCTGAPVAIHVLTELPDHLKGALVGVALSPQPGRALYLPLDGVGNHLGAAGARLISAWCRDDRFPKICHEGKRAWVTLARYGILLRGVVGDTALASYLLDPTDRVPHRLEQVARAFLRRGLQPLAGVIGRGRARKSFSALTVDRAGAWACHLADATGEAWPLVKAAMEEQGLLDVFWDLDVPLSPILGQMELDGVALSPGPLELLESELIEERDQVEQVVFGHAGHPFHIGSVKQLGTVLFDELGLPILKRTKTGYSTATDVLKRLRPRHPIVAEVERWRALAKLIDAYTKVLLQARAPDGRIHATYQQTVSASGRLITTEPDVQRTPVRTQTYRRVREAFVPSPGWQILSADWSQIELRLLAHVSADPRLMDAYTTGRDVHRETAAELFGTTPGEVSRAQREVGKTVNFATIYGQGATALAQSLDVGRDQASQYIKTFFLTYAGVDRWRDRVIAEAYRDGYVTTLLGRKRYISELSGHSHSDRSYGERIAVNTPIQGSGADICKLAMLRIAQAMKERKLRSKMVLQVHDELLFDVPPEELRALTALVREVMESVVQLAVPLVVDIGVGDSWATAH